MDAPQCSSWRSHPRSRLALTIRGQEMVQTGHPQALPRYSRLLRRVPSRSRQLLWPSLHKMAMRQRCRRLVTSPGRTPISREALGALQGDLAMQPSPPTSQEPHRWCPVRCRRHLPWAARQGAIHHHLRAVAGHGRAAVEARLPGRGGLHRRAPPAQPARVDTPRLEV